jgi:uncharacterized membrane protein YqaE (UPF0057 family)
MRYINTFMCMAILAIFVSSCSENTVGGGGLQKRKYTKGFYLGRNHSHKSPGDRYSAKADAPIVMQTEETEVEAQAIEPAEVKNEQATIRPEVPVSSDQSEKNQKPLQNQKTPAKKKTAEQKSTKPIVPTRPKRERENDYFIPVKDKKPAILQKSSGHSGGMDDMQILAIIFAILIPPLGVAIFEGITTRFWISLLLTILFFFPGMIYALLVVCGVI